MNILFPDLRLTQSALADFAECPLRFRYRHVEGLRMPPEAGPEALRGSAAGHAFHVLAHRYFAGLEPVTPPETEASGLLASWLVRLRAAFPLPDPQGRTLLPEYELTLNPPDPPLMARMDLLALGPHGQATIYDWKTGRWPLPELGGPSLQTRVYRLTVALAGPYYGAGEPEGIRMVYWHPEAPSEPIELPYSSALLEEDRAVVGEVLERVLTTPPEAMAPVPSEEGCRRCEYRPLCFGLAREELAEEEAATELLATLDWSLGPEEQP